jgi:two-component system, OmpR family, sensor kinase
VSSVADRLAALFGLVVLGGLLVVFLGVVPTLDRSLREQQLDALLASAERFAPPVAELVGTSADDARVDAAVRTAADGSGARVTLVRYSRGTEGLQGFVQSDSTSEREIRDLRFAVADEAARTTRPRTGTEAADEGRVGQAAVPLVSVVEGRRVAGSVLVFSVPLDDVEAQVDLVERRLLVAGGIALLAAVVAGWLIARQLAARLRRMEEAALRVARGDFEGSFPGGGEDEVDRLAAALDDMQRQLSELDSARRRFIATASHELRTPLFSLRGFVELLESDELDEDERATALTQLRLGVERLSRLATDLLDLSRLEAGALQLREEPVDVGALARAVADEFQPALAAHESHLELRLGSGDGRVEATCDPDRVAQVMRILIDNALTHTPAGTDVVVAAGRREERLRVAVTDFGPGLRRGDATHVFEPFVTSDDAAGSGLGLAIAKELAERMAGELDVESRPGRTTFALEVPAGPRRG